MSHKNTGCLISTQDYADYTVSYPLFRKGIVLIAPYRNPHESTTIRGVARGLLPGSSQVAYPFAYCCG